jgi:DNA modification methylase
MNYDDFIKTKSFTVISKGIESAVIPDCLFDYQKAVVTWALKKGRAAIFAGTGLGKTLMELAWAVNIPGKVLFFAPLAVAHQVEREANKFGFDLSNITITNYEKLHHYNPDDYSGVVLDESSILKAFDGKTKDLLIQSFQRVPYRLAATATPAPNDFMELGNHAEFLGVMSYVEMLATFFVHDGGETSKWRLKGHAKKEFWKWMAQWSVMFQSPADIGFDGSRHILPPLNQYNITVDSDISCAGADSLFRFEANTLQERIQERRNSITERVKAACDIANNSNEQWLVWCNMNAEGDALEKGINDAIQVSGSDKDDFKIRSVMDFAENKNRVLISKPRIFGYGMNLQNCHNMIFCGLNDSWEQVYQAVRRCWRFGQTKPVNVYFIASQLEGNVVANLERKNQQAKEMMQAMIEEMKDFQTEQLTATTQEKADYKTNVISNDNFTAYLGDCVEVARSLPDNSIDYSIYSPPFSSLYTYSNSDRDMGNCKNDEEFFKHYVFLIKEMYRILRPGRLISFHCMNLPTTKTRDGFIGIKDFRGELIRVHQDAGFIYHSEVCIWKDPVIAMQRTKALGLLHKQIKKDSAMSRQGIPDYLVTMRKDGENTKPISHTNETFPVQLWQQYASPIWMDINPSDTLQFRSAREHDDEKHICPLQLQVIERAMDLWTAPDDLVFSPFMGIGSEGYVALQKGRRFVGSELKESYYKQAVKNLESVRPENAMPLFAGI